MAKKTESKPDKLNAVIKGVNLWALSGEIGFKLTLPLLIFMLVGIKIDKTFNTTPLFILVGLGVSMLSSAYLVYQIIQKINSESKSK